MRENPSQRLRSRDVLLLAAWFALATSLGEMAIVVLAKGMFGRLIRDPNEIVWLTPLAELSANAAYTGAGKPSIDYYVTAKGMVFVDEAGARNAELTPDVAKKLAADPNFNVKLS